MILTTLTCVKEQSMHIDKYIRIIILVIFLLLHKNLVTFCTSTIIRPFINQYLSYGGIVEGLSDVLHILHSIIILTFLYINILFL